MEKGNWKGQTLKNCFFISLRKSRGLRSLIGLGLGEAEGKNEGMVWALRVYVFDFHCRLIFEYLSDFSG